MKNVAVDLFNRPKLHKLLLNMNRTTLPRFTDSNNHHDKMTLTWLEGSPRVSTSCSLLAEFGGAQCVHTDRAKH